jgi:protein-disulfide isomerase
MATALIRSFAVILIMVLAFCSESLILPTELALAIEFDGHSVQQAEVEYVIHNHVLPHHETLIGVAATLQDRQEEAEHQRIASVRTQLLYSKGSPVLHPNGNITIVEFFDYQCPYCRQAMETIFSLIAVDPTLRVVFKEFPILGSQSIAAARAALAAQAQNRYIEMHQALMNWNGPLTNEAIFNLAAKQAGLDIERLRRDMESDLVSQEIASNQKLAHILRIHGTPAFIVDDEIMPGMVGLDSIHRLIAQKRNHNNH